MSFTYLCFIVSACSPFTSCFSQATYAFYSDALKHNSDLFYFLSSDRYSFDMGDGHEDCAVLDEQGPSQRPSKLPRRERAHRPIVDSIVLSSLVSSYTTHFATYSSGRRNVTQLVPGKVWKLVYEQFLREHLGSKFAEDTLKDRLRETLKELKIGTSNEEGFEKAVLQLDDVLTRLRSTDSHATRNILKLRQTMLEQSSFGGNPPTLGQVQDGSVHLQTSGGGRGHCSPSPSSTQKLPTKAELLAAQSKSMTAIARTMEARSEGKGALLSLKMDIKMEK